MKTTNCMLKTAETLVAQIANNINFPPRQQKLPPHPSPFKTHFQRWNTTAVDISIDI